MITIWVRGVAAGTLIAGGVFLWLRRRFRVIVVHGESMRPTYQPGDRLLVRRIRADAIRRGHCVVFRDEDIDKSVRWISTPPAEWIVKRALAVPGDQVPLNQIPVLRTATEPVVPPGHLVVLGDNPERSYDSRHFGYVTADRVLGIVLRRMAEPKLPSTGTAAL
jgi:signal peptidase I